jgi:hypothetical protein
MELAGDARRECGVGCDRSERGARMEGGVSKT